jgi:hypothetical protein
MDQPTHLWHLHVPRSTQGVRLNACSRALCQVANLVERARHMGLLARDKNACRDDGVQRLAAQQLFLVRAFVEPFGDVADHFGQRGLVTPARNVAKWERRFRSEREFWERVAAHCSSRAMPVPPSLKPMMVSSCSIPSIRGSPSSFAKVLGRLERLSSYQLE